MPALPSFISSAYTARSKNLAADRLVNLYPEVVQTTRGKNVAAFHGTPGLRRTYFLQGSGGAGGGGIRGLYRISNADRTFAVRDSRLFELFLNGGSAIRGNLNTNTGHVSIADNGSQLIVVDGANGYILTLATNTFSQISDPDFPATTQVVFIDGYFVFFTPGTDQFGVTGLNDGFTVDSLDVATAEGSPDDLVAIAADHRELWLLGTRSIEIWFNSGNVDFPFDRIAGAYLEYGCGAAFSVANLDNTIYWLGSDERGRHTIWRAQGYQPQRISTHAVEFAISGYSADSVANARAYTYYDEGHAFYVINFAEATWAYDASTDLWHERAYLDGEGVLGRHRGDCHAVAFGDNIVGDYNNGSIYTLDLDTYTDDGEEIVRLRACPHYAAPDLERLFHHWFQLDMEGGVGVQGPAGGEYVEGGYVDDDYVGTQVVTTSQNVNPSVFLRWSDDGGHTWSQPKLARLGKVGRYRTRAYWNRLGTSRDRVYEVRQTDGVKAAWINATVRATPGRH